MLICCLLLSNEFLSAEFWRHIINKLKCVGLCFLISNLRLFLRPNDMKLCDLYGTLYLRNFRKHSNHAGLRTYMKVYRYMKKVGLRRYLISSIKPSFFECSHDVNSYIINIAYFPCACKKILWFTGESFFKSVVDKITISRPCSRKQKKIMLLQDELFL